MNKKVSFMAKSIWVELNWDNVLRYYVWGIEFEFTPIPVIILMKKMTRVRYRCLCWQWSSKAQTWSLKNILGMGGMYIVLEGKDRGMMKPGKY